MVRLDEWIGRAAYSKQVLAEGYARHLDLHTRADSSSCWPIRGRLLGLPRAHELWFADHEGIVTC